MTAYNAPSAADILAMKPARILTARMEETLLDCARLMARENVGALVVTDVVGTEGTTVVGIFSERDLMRAMVAQGAPALARPVSALMSRHVITVKPEDDLRHVLDLMHRHHVRHLPVIDNHQLVGVISVRDLIALRLAEIEGKAPETCA